MIAYDKRGRVFALREGAELLVHDGESEGPLWRKMLDGDIVGVGADSEHVAAVTATGTVTWFDAEKGDLVATGAVGGSVERAVFLDATTCIAVTASRIVSVTQSGSTTLAEHGARAVAARPDGGVCVHHDGELVEMAGGSRAMAPLGNLVTALAWHPGGFWLVGADNKILRWDGQSAPSHVTQIPDAGAIEHIAACDKAIAFSWDKKFVGEMGWPSKNTMGDLMYVDKDVEGLDFGPWPWLGVSISQGDANKHNLLQPSRLHRSDTHPGREHHSWLVQVGGGGADRDDDEAGVAASAGEPSRRAAAGRQENPASAALGLAILAVIGVVVWLLVR